MSKKKADKEAKLTAMILSGLMTTPDDGLAKFQTRRLGRDSTLNDEQMRLLRDVSITLGGVLRNGGDDDDWNRVAKIAELLDVKHGILAPPPEASENADAETQVAPEPDDDGPAPPEMLNSSTAVTLSSDDEEKPAPLDAGPPPVSAPPPVGVTAVTAVSSPYVRSSPAVVSPSPSVSKVASASLSAPTPAPYTPPAAAPPPAVEPVKPPVAPAPIAPAPVAPAPATGPPSATAQAVHSIDEARGPGSAKTGVMSVSAESLAGLPFVSSGNRGRSSMQSSPDLSHALPFQSPAATNSAVVPPSTSQQSTADLSSEMNGATVEGYAALCALCRVFPQKIEGTQAAFGLNDAEMRKQLDGHWASQFQAQPAKRELWQALCGQLEKWLVAHGGP